MHASFTNHANRQRWPARLVVLGTVLYAAWFSWFTIARAHNFNAGWYDLGIMTQTVWRFGHGLGFTFTNPEIGPGGVHGWESLRTAIHTDYLLVLLAPLSWTGRTMESLLILQAVVLALGGWLVFRIARTVLKSAWAGVLLAAAYFFYPPLHFASIFEFHAVTLAITFVLGMADAIGHDRRRWFWAWFGLALLSKEQVGMTVGILAALMWWWKGHRRLAWMSLGIGWAWALLQILVVIPISRPDLPGSFVYTKFYASAGDDAGSVLQRLLHPADAWHRLATRTHLHDVVQLLTPLGIFLPIIGGLAVIAIPEMLIYWLSDSPNQQTLFLHYHALAIPYLFLSTIAGWYWLRKMGHGAWGMGHVGQRIVNVVCLVAIVLGSIQASRAWSDLPWSPITRWPAVAWKEKLTPQVQTALRLVPRQASAAFTQNLGPLMAERPVAQLLPNGIHEVAYIIILERSFDPNIPTNDKRLAERDMLQLLKQWMAQQPEAFRQVYHHDRVYVFRRIGEPRLPEPVWPGALLGR